MSANRRPALTELDRLTTVLRDGTDRLARQLAALEAAAYPHRRKKAA